MLGHAVPSDSYFFTWIYGFHMPLFFVCSGFFYKKKPFWEAEKKDVRTLIVPWMTFSVFLVFCSFILEYVSNGEGPVFHPLDENCWILYYTIWFLICLFSTRFIYRLIRTSCNMLITNIVIVIGYVAAFLLNHFEINVPFFVDSSLAMLLFYHVGYLFKTWNLHDSKQPIWLSIMTLLVYSLFIYFVKPEVNIKENVFPVYLILLSLVPIYALYQLSCRLNNKFLLSCGLASLTIMGFHHPIYDVVMFPLMNRLPLLPEIEMGLMVVLTLMITLIIHKLLLKVSPFLIGK